MILYDQYQLLLKEFVCWYGGKKLRELITSKSLTHCLLPIQTFTFEGLWKQNLCQWDLKSLTHCLIPIHSSIQRLSNAWMFVKTNFLKQKYMLESFFRTQGAFQDCYSNFSIVLFYLKWFPREPISSCAAVPLEEVEKKFIDFRLCLLRWESESKSQTTRKRK